MQPKTVDNPDNTALRVAIVHHWLVTMRGGERVLEVLCNMFPNAEIFTHVYVPSRVSETLRTHKVHTSFINRLPLARKVYQWYLPLMPMAIERFDLRDFDLVISSDSGPVKGIVTSAETPHICYCYTPMRYIWGMQADYLENARWSARVAFPPIAHYMRLWDYAASARVDKFVAISNTVSRRIRKNYRRQADIIFPPVKCDDFKVHHSSEDFYLLAGQLVAYKRPELAIEACNRLKKPLVVIGEGERLNDLKRLAGPTVTMLGAVPTEILREYLGRCRALLFPGEEDFGIVPVEAMASGKPVIALGKGGALDTVADGLSGVFFKQPTVDSLVEAIERFETIESSFDPDRIAEHAKRFDQSVFEKAFGELVKSTMAEFSNHDLPDDGRPAIEAGPA